MIDLPPPLPLRPNRVHEATGPAAASFAAMICAQMAGDVLWLSEQWHREQINPVGLAEFCDPARLIFAHPRDQPDLLAACEEGLRSGQVGLVIAQVTRPLSLLAGRRLQLAAETGGATGLCLIPDDMGSNAAETRWRCAPVFDSGDSTLQEWQIIKNKSGTFGRWTVRWDAQARRINMVSQARQ